MRPATAVEAYFIDLGWVHVPGGTTGERSSYGPLANLPNSVGATLKPKVSCVDDLAGQRASCCDFGFYEGTEVTNSRSFVGQTLKCGVEVKITLPGRWSDVAADDAVGAVAVSAARTLGDTITMFGGRARGVGRNG